MPELRYDEFNFLFKSLNISEGALTKLTEDLEDLDNLLYVAAQSKLLTKEDFLKFSPHFGFTLIIFKYSFDYDFPFKEKKYICKLVEDHYPKLLYGVTNGSSLKTLMAFREVKACEESSKSLLIASGLLNTYLKLDLNSKTSLRFIEDGFWGSGLRDLAAHLPDWVIILRKIQNDGWLNRTTRKELELHCKTRKV